MQNLLCSGKNRKGSCERMFAQVVSVPSFFIPLVTGVTILLGAIFGGLLSLCFVNNILLQSIDGVFQQVIFLLVLAPVIIVFGSMAGGILGSVIGNNF